MTFGDGEMTQGSRPSACTLAATNLSVSEKHRHPIQILTTRENTDMQDLDFLNETLFNQMLWLEQKRAERSGRGSMLVLLNPSSLLDGNRRNYQIFKRITKALTSCFRETDIKGWCQQDTTIGVILTEVTSTDQMVRDRIYSKMFEKK